MSPNWIIWGEGQEALLYFLKQILLVLFLLFAVVVFIGDPGKTLKKQCFIILGLQTT